MKTKKCLKHKQAIFLSTNVPSRIISQSMLPLVLILRTALQSSIVVQFIMPAIASFAIILCCVGLRRRSRRNRLRRSVKCGNKVKIVWQSRKGVCIVEAYMYICAVHDIHMYACAFNKSCILVIVSLWHFKTMMIYI